MPPVPVDGRFVTDAISVTEKKRCHKHTQSSSMRTVVRPRVPAFPSAKNFSLVRTGARLQQQLADGRQQLGRESNGWTLKPVPASLNKEAQKAPPQTNELTEHSTKNTAGISCSTAEERGWNLASEIKASSCGKRTVLTQRRPGKRTEECGACRSRDGIVCAWLC